MIVTKDQSKERLLDPLNDQKTPTSNANSTPKTNFSNNINSNSSLRKYFYNLKKRMIIQPMKNIFITLCAGFLVNVQVMISIVIIFEKLKDNLLSYSAGIVPLIVLASMILTLCVASVVMLLLDLLKQGCLAWHRDSLGVLVQKIVFSLCMLLTFISLHEMVYCLENDQTPNHDAITVFGCFVPIIVFIALSCCKMVCFKIRDLFLWTAITGSLIALIVIFSLKYDLDKESIPIFTIFIPVATILMAFTVHQIWQVVFQADAGKKLIYCLDQKYKAIFTVVTCCITICYVISIMASLYLIQQRGAYKADIRDLLEFILIISFVYAMVQMEAIGSITLDIVFEQFNFELIENSQIPNRSKFLQFKHPQKNYQTPGERSAHASFDKNATTRNSEKIISNGPSIKVNTQRTITPIGPRNENNKPLQQINGNQKDDNFEESP